MIPSEIRVAVLYPWTGLPDQDRGAARRMVPMAELLAEHFRSVTILAPGDNSRSSPMVKNKVHYTFFYPSPAESAVLRSLYWFYDGVTYHAMRGRVSIRERRQWWHFLQPSWQWSLHRALRKALSQADAVILEYPFWSRILHRIMGADRKPVILTLPDLVSDIVSIPWFKTRVSNLEKTACRRASEVVCGSRAEQKLVAEWGFSTEFVPHSMKLPMPEESGATTPESSFPGMERVENAARAGDMICLFVGSSLEPNRKAAEEIQDYADRLSNERGIFFIIAGSCCGPMTKGSNLVSLGPVPEKCLHRIYAVSEVALAPIRSGSGASLKVLEALARKKVLISTSMGVRSHGIQHEREALLCENRDEYPKLLIRLKNNPEERESLKAAGWDFIQAFDSETVNLPYLRLISEALSNT